MPADPTPRYPPDLIKGSTELLVLAVLSREELHGYAILARLRERSGERLRLNEGALYPLLHRMVRDGKVRAATSTVGGRERKTYALTPSGKRAFAANCALWAAWRDFVDEVVNAQAGGHEA